MTRGDRREAAAVEAGGLLWVVVVGEREEVGQGDTRKTSDPAGRLRGRSGRGEQKWLA